MTRVIMCGTEYINLEPGARLGMGHRNTEKHEPKTEACALKCVCM